MNLVLRKIERIIITAHPINYFVDKSKRWILPGFEGAPLYDVIQFFKKQLGISALTERASAIAYNFIMSIPPACLFLFTLIPNLPFVSKKNLKIQVHVLFDSITPSKVHDHSLLNFIYSFIDSSRIGHVSSAFILSLFFASNAIMGLMRSFDRNYIGFEKRKALQKRWVAIKLTCLLFLLFLICMILLLSQSSVLSLLGVKNTFIKELIVYGRWIPILGLLFYSFAFIYRYAPATQKRWKLLSPGTLFATFFSILFYSIFSLFVNSYGRYNLLYGSLGTLMVLMILVFLNSLSILIGFELNVSIKSLKAIADERKKKEEGVTAKNNDRDLSPK